MIRKVGSLGRFGGPILVDRIVANSVAVAISDAVSTTSGFAVLGTAGNAVLGHVVGIVGQDSLTPVKDGTFLNNPGDEYTVAGDNQTVAQVRVVVDASQDALYSAELDGTIGTTAGPVGVNYDLVDEDTLDETSAVDAIAQYYSHGADRNNTDNALVNIAESEVFAR